MAKGINKFIVRLQDQTGFKPKLTVSVVPIKELKKTYEVRLINPNTKEIAYKEQFISKLKQEMDCFVEAINFGKKLLEKPEMKELQQSIEYKEQLFIPQGKRGKMKLKTKDSAEAIAERKQEELSSIKEKEVESNDLPEFVPEDVEIVEEVETVVEVEETKVFDDSFVKDLIKKKSKKVINKDKNKNKNNDKNKKNKKMAKKKVKVKHKKK